MNFGRALYYPYINFSNLEWLKCAALYYEGLERIVPVGFNNFTDQEIIKRFNDQEEFIKNIDPQPAAKKVAEKFLNFVLEHLEDSKKREAFLVQIDNVISKDEPFFINDLKVAATLQPLLQDLGLIRQTQGESIEFEPVAGSMYMTFLANEISKGTYLPLVTDDPVFQSLNTLDRYGQYGFNPVIDKGYMLASLVITSCVPENINNITIDQINKFRKENAENRISFYEEINKIAKDIKEIDNASTLTDCLQYHKKNIDLKVGNLKRSFKSMSISTVDILCGVTVPIILPGKSIITSTAIGLIAVGLNKLWKQQIDLSQKKAESPYSYILSINKNLNAKSYLRQYEQAVFAR